MIVNERTQNYVQQLNILIYQAVNEFPIHSTDLACLLYSIEWIDVATIFSTYWTDWT